MQAGNVEAVVAVLQEQLRAYGFASVKVYTTYIHALIKASGKGKPGAPMALDSWQRLDAAKKPKPAVKGRGSGRGGATSNRSSSSGSKGDSSSSSGRRGSEKGGSSSEPVGDLIYNGWLRLKATGQPLDAQAYLAGKNPLAGHGWM